MSFGSTFLGDPGKTTEGPAWGSERLVLDIAGRIHTVEGLSRSQKDALSRLYRSFVIPDRGVPADIRLHRIGDDAFLDFDKRGWEYTLEVDYGAREVRLVGIDLVGRLTWRRGLRGSLAMPADGERCHGPIENFLRVFTAYASLEASGVFLHSAAVAMGSEVCLFVGPSGAGKSTVAKSAVASGREVLSDDLNPVTWFEAEPVVHGCPFFGDIGKRSRASLPLDAIYRLEKGSQDAVRALSPAEAVASLLACTPYVNVDPHRQGAVLALLGELTARVPAYALTFRREGTFWPLLEAERIPSHA